MSNSIISSQFQNPNFDRLTYSLDDQSHDLAYFDHIAKYLMSNEGEGFEENMTLENEDFLSQDVTNRSNGSNLYQASSPPRNVKCKRKLKKYKTEEELRFAFRTKTNLEFMDDGYKWRKYGKKMVKNSPNPRNYFKCSIGGCLVKKRVERDRDDPSYVITTYQGMHNHYV